MKRLFLLLILLGGVTAGAQTLTVRVQATGARPLPYASVVLAGSGRQAITTRVADSLGQVVFTSVPSSATLLRSTAVGFADYEQQLPPLQKDAAVVITMTPGGRSLGEVTVTATKPLVRQEDDKTIVDPEPLATAATNAYEILEKTPGMFADPDGNVFLTSTTPAAIFINGREQRMSAADIATMLKSLPPNAIASIEIMRTPSARYDASGSGGIINIILKKGVRIGLTGSVNVGFNQGQYGNQFAGFSLNNVSGKWSSFINLQYNRRDNYELLISSRVFGGDTLLQQSARTLYPAQSVYANFGSTYSPSRFWDISYDGRVTLNASDNRSVNRSLINTISTQKPVSENEATVGTENEGLVLVQGLSAKRKWDREGTEWTADASYTLLPSSLHQDFVTTYLLPLRRALPANGEQDRDVHQLQVQTNFSHRLPGSVKLETGLKTTNIWFRSQADFGFMVNGNRVPDRVRTNRYRYDEHLHASYLQASRSFGRVVVKGGVRVEHTRMSGTQQVPYDTAFTLRRTDPFPYLYISRTVMKIAGYDLRAYLVYRRTINRPAYEYLNPAPRVIDPYLYETGNPGLRPQFTQNFEANVSVDERPIIAVGLNNTKDIFSQVVYQADSSSAVTYRTYDNLGRNREVYFRALGVIPPGKRYFFVAGVQYNHNLYDGRYEKAPLTFSRGSWTVFTFHSFRIDKRSTITMNGFARFKGQLQFYELSSFGTLNFSVNRTFMDKKLTVGLSMNDVLFTNNNNFMLNQGSIRAEGYRENDTRRVGVNIRYNFGFRKKEESGLLNLMNTEPANSGN